MRASIAWARARGDTITLTLRTASGNSAEVELVRAGSANTLPVIYMPREPVIIDDHTAAPLILGTPLNVKMSEETVLLKVKDGEVVTASIDDSETSFIVFDTWVQEGIANQRRNFEQLRELFQMTIADPVATREAKEMALQKTRMIDNFEKLVTYQSPTNDTYTDLTRIKLAELYGNLLQSYGYSDGAGNIDTKWPDLTPDKYGVVYATRNEYYGVGNAIAAGRARYIEMLGMMGTEILIGTYDFLANMTGAAQFVAVVWAIDTHGNRIDATDRVFAGIGLGSQLLLVGATTAGQISRLSSESKLTGSWAELLQRDMIAAQKRMLANENAAAGVVAGSTRASPRPGATSPALGPGNKPNMAANLIERQVEKIYRPHELRYRDHRPFQPLDATDPTFELPIPSEPLNSKGTPMQIGNGSCGLAVGEGGMRDIGYDAVGENVSLTQAMSHGNFAPIKTPPGQPNFIGGGMTAVQLSLHLGNNGAVTKVMANVMNKSVLATINAGLRKGKQYYGIINSGTAAKPAWHWVRIEGFTCGNGKAWAHVGDPWQGASFKIPPKMLSARLQDVVEADWADFKATMDGPR